MTDPATNLKVVEGGKEDLPKPGSKSWATKVRKKAKELMQTLDTGYMDLARLLYQVYDIPVDGDPQRAPVYTLWGHSSFGEYAEKELGIAQRKAERLRRIWWVLEVQLGGMDTEIKSRVVALGYSKVRELIRVLTIRTAKEWVDLAETTSFRQLCRHIDDHLAAERVGKAVADAEVAAGGADPSDFSNEGAPEPPEDDSEPEPEEPPVPRPDTSGIKQERFDLYPDQQATVEQAIYKASELSNSNFRGHNLSLICLDFLATNDFMGQDMDKRLRYIAKLEKTLGLRLVAIDAEAKDIVYGVEALKIVTES